MAFDVVILPSFAQVETWCKEHADERASGLFAQTVTTFDAWIADLWELHGDGRVIVSDMQRQILMQHVLELSGAGLDSPGIAPMASSCMRKAVGVTAFEAALDAAQGGREIEGLSDRETAFLRALAHYRESLHAHGLVELGEAAALLASRASEVFPRELDVLLPDAAPLTWVQLQFFEACQQLRVEVRLSDGAQGIGGAPEGVSVRFAFPSGRLAEPGLIADLAIDAAQAGDVVVACKDPIDIFERTHRRLAQLGLAVRVQARKPFSQSDFGRAFLAMVRCLHSDPWDASALSDVLYSPFAGFTQADALRIDAEVRANRVAAREDVLMQLRALSEPFSQLEEIASDPDADVLVGAFEHMAQSATHRPQTWRTEQLAAMGALRDAAAAARHTGVGIEACASALERATLPVSACVDGAGPTVTFTTQALAARMGEGSCASLIIADLTSEDYPVADKDDAAATLFASLGLEPAESALSRARREFSALVKLPTSALFIARPLGDANAEPTYPAVVLEEFVDACRAADAPVGDETDDVFRLPASMRSGLVERGEERLYANARAEEPNAAQAESASIAKPLLDGMSSRAIELVMPARHDSQGRAIGKPCPSPSQIEAYLECPYQWFATRRLRIDELDEGFGPLERGNFAHAALEGFYRQFQALGHAKVAPENLAAAQKLMREVAGDIAQAQFSEEPKSGRLVPATELERREVAALIDQLVAYLNFEATLLPTFHPAYFEYEIPADNPVEYAGYALIGKVDRIDVDGKGHAVVIDYKGSVNAEHDIAGKDFSHAGKVQTRIYAQAVKRALGLDVVGALYVSYGRVPGVTGAYDPRVIEAAHLPGAHTDKCACGTLEELPDETPDGFTFADLAFDAMLDATEQVAARAIAGMCAGDVSCRPSTNKACAWCPVLSCPKRGA